jgi:hypothetical protein
VAKQQYGPGDERLSPLDEAEQLVEHLGELLRTQTAASGEQVAFRLEPTVNALRLALARL